MEGAKGCEASTVLKVSNFAFSFFPKGKNPLSGFSRIGLSVFVETRLHPQPTTDVPVMYRNIFEIFSIRKYEVRRGVCVFQFTLQNLRRGLHSITRSNTALQLQNVLKNCRKLMKRRERISHTISAIGLKLQCVNFSEMLSCRPRPSSSSFESTLKQGVTREFT